MFHYKYVVCPALGGFFIKYLQHPHLFCFAKTAEQRDLRFVDKQCMFVLSYSLKRVRKNCEKHLLAYSCLSIRMEKLYCPTARIFMELHICEFSENLTGKNLISIKI